MAAKKIAEAVAWHGGVGSTCHPENPEYCCHAIRRLSVRMQHSGLDEAHPCDHPDMDAIAVMADQVLGDPAASTS